MSAVNIGSISAKIFDIVDGLDHAEKIKVFKAVYALCDIDNFSITDASTNSLNQSQHLPEDSTLLNTRTQQNSDPASYLVQKSPQTKIEYLAVAAKFREEYQNTAEHTKDDFIAFFVAARKNFDHSNFKNDISNAKRAGLFLKTNLNSHAHKLSYNGQNYVDALPDQAKAATFLTKSTAKKKPKKNIK